MGTRDVVGPRRGALVPADDEADFARHIVMFCNDPALRARLAAQARPYAAEWSAEALARRMADAYQDVVDSKPRSARDPLSPALSHQGRGSF
jgi:1,2-diacylglycerol 3-alpha-glucosyltransferase